MKRSIMKNLLTWKGEKGRKPLIIKGVRQVGKTYILKEFGAHHFPRFHYINFEQEPGLNKIFEPDLVPKRIINELSFHLGRSINVATDLVIFDEIQECPLALTSLKYFFEECPELCICAAGSLLGIHLNSGSFPVGKVTFQTLRPMSFEEFLRADGDDRSLSVIEKLSLHNKIPQVVHEYLWNQLKRYFVVGGMPEAVSTYCKHKDDLFEAFTLVRRKQDDLVKSYYADIAKHSGKVNAMHIDRVFHSVPSQLSQAEDRSVARFRFRGIVPGLTHYNRIAGAIDWLEATGLVLKVPMVDNGYLPLKGHTKENIFKLYLFDVGILGSMSGLFPKTLLDYEYGTYKGYFAENFVAQELFYNGIENLFGWHENKAEVEFLAERDGAVIPLEVKSGNVTKAKSLHSFAEKYAPPYQVIFSGKALNITQGIHYYPLYLAGCFPLQQKALTEI